MKFDKNQQAYTDLRDIIAERTKGVVFCVGSGLSVDAGLPTWDGLKEILTETLSNQTLQLDDRPEIERLQATINSIRQESNNWLAFQRLRKELGETTWRSVIRDTLTPLAGISTPRIYTQLWRLDPHGMLSVNLDNLATKAYWDARPTSVLTRFDGNNVAQYAHVLKNPNPFICQLHGNLDDYTTWVLTHTQLNNLKDNRAYRNFMTACLLTKTLVFVGVSVDDTAIAGFVQHMSALGIDAGSHFWITSRRDITTDRWAEEQGIRLIRYRTVGNDHSALRDMTEDILRFMPPDDHSNAPPVLSNNLKSLESVLPSQAEMFSYGSEKVRELLNQEASRIINTNQDYTNTYRDFLLEYDEEVYRSWYVSTSTGKNKLLGYELHDEVASGTFGKVYYATDPNGEQVAVKILHEQIRHNTDALMAFRRGVRSMRILGDRGVEGMVPYRDAFEIPAIVVMDWVDGLDLRKAVLSRQIRDWDQIVRTASLISDIVRRGHVLPERVLHRDIRPSNVMLRNFYSDQDNLDVVVLDFDLSWHRDAFEKSVLLGSPTLGYLAPEQIEDIPGVSTRHAAVDSFGLGMVLFFMVNGRDPVQNEHRHTDWKKTLSEAAESHPCAQWKSLPIRFVRLIEVATQQHQSERWDMTQIQSELGRLYETIVNPRATVSAELIAEEVAARCEFGTKYDWDSETLTATRERSSGVKFEVRGDESSRRIVVNLVWGNPGVHGLDSLGKWIEPAMLSARDILHSAGWQVEIADSRYAYISISASLPATQVMKDMDKLVEQMNRALHLLSRPS